MAVFFNGTKVSNLYFNNTKLQRGYFNGVQVFTGRTLATPITVGRSFGASPSANVGGRVIFVGGYLDSFTSALVHTTISASNFSSSYCGSNNSNYMFQLQRAGTPSTVAAISTSFVLSSKALLATHNVGISITSGNSEYVYITGGGPQYGYIESISNSLVSAVLANTPGNLSYIGNSGTVGIYALLIGGITSTTGTYGNYIVAYSTSSVASTVSIITGLAAASAANTSNHIVIAGVRTGTTAAASLVATKDVYALSSSLVKTTLSSTPYFWYSMAGARAGTNAVFSNGATQLTSTATSSTNTNLTMSYSENLVQSWPGTSTKAKTNVAGGSVGNYALFAGGGNSTLVEVFDQNVQ